MTLSSPQLDDAYDAAIDSDLLATGIVLLDADWRVRQINPAAESLLQISSQRALNAFFYDLIANGGHWQPVLQQALTENLPMVRRDMPLLTLHGDQQAVDVTLSPTLQPNSRRLLLEFSPVDRLNAITEGENLWQSQMTMQTIVRGLAHEIKNPLGGIRGAAQLLATELKAPEYREYTEIIIKEADRLRALVDRLLGPRERLATRQTNIHEILHRVQQLLTVESEGQMALVRDYDPSLPEFAADPDQVIQAILNIARNAWEAMPEGGKLLFRTRVRRQYTLAGKRHRLVCAVEIIDNGPGISERLMPQIFLPTVTTRSDGSGLGLSIAQMIANRHGGLVQCQSQPGETIFTLLLPIEGERHEHSQ